MGEILGLSHAMFSTYVRREDECQANNAFKEKVHRNNIPLYLGWGVAALYRSCAWIHAVTQVFRNDPSASLAAPATLSGTTDTTIQAALGGVTVFALWEFVVTLVVFGKDAHRYKLTRERLDKNRKHHDEIQDFINAQKDVSHTAKKEARRRDELVETVQLPVAPLPKGDVDAMVRSYLEYEAACIDLPGVANKLKHSSCMFARDGLAQGASIGCNLALMAGKYRLADLLQLAAAPIDAGLTAICGGALSIVGGVLHVVAAVLALKDAEEKLSLVARAKTKIDKAIETVERAKKELHPTSNDDDAAMVKALVITKCLLTKAGANEDGAEKTAQHDISVAELRIGFGTVAAIVGAASLTLLLVLGGLTTGGILFAAVAALALTAWTSYASYRNKTYRDEAAAATAAKEEAAPMTLDDAIRDAAQLFDRGNFTADQWRAGKNARRLLKESLLGIGMNRLDFHALRFGMVFGELGRETFREVLKNKIRNCVAGDGLRRATAAERSEPQKNEAGNAEGSPAAPPAAV